jgi:hypothetical protein
VASVRRASVVRLLGLRGLVKMPLVSKYDVFVNGSHHATYYTNGAVRGFIESCLNCHGFKPEDFRVEKDGQQLTIDVVYSVSIGGM